MTDTPEPETADAGGRNTRSRRGRPTLRKRRGPRAPGDEITIGAQKQTEIGEKRQGRESLFLKERMDILVGTYRLQADKR